MPASPDFYLGKLFDSAQGKTLETPLLLDPANLTTHGVITGMTGSGKTGLGIVLLEEAALQGVPAIIIDPKGDLGNLLLHFPELRPGDFQPWIDPEVARRAGKPLETLAGETAKAWQAGLAGWGLGREQLKALRDAVEYTVYTPGSSAGQGVNILSSFQPPELPWEENREVLREKISSTVTALLGLIGLGEIDPLRSREHILVANVLENAWSTHQPLDLAELIVQVQNPPFQRLGAFAVDSFFPAKDRFDLAMLLNNFLAAPSFQTWLEGEPIDIGAMLFRTDGKPRHSIFYLAHLSESERMFFTTLLFASVEAWMRTQRGTSGLRAMVYFDEILGYLPPLNNPPSKPILLRMLKQARAFGVGLLLATQNPVDVDYKALSNAGTWFVGRLQTERDKQRLMDGLSAAAGGLDTAQYNRLISGLQKRVFLLHDVHSDGPRLFQTRWTLNYLAGPLTRAQIPDLIPNSAAEQSAPEPAQPTDETQPIPVVPPTAQTRPTPAIAPTAAVPMRAVTPTGSKPVPAVSSNGFSLSRPAIPAGAGEYFLAADWGVSQSAAAARLNPGVPLSPEGLVYRPALLAQAQVRYLSNRYALDYTRSAAALVRELEGSIMKWEEYAWRVFPLDALQSQPLPQTRFAALPGWLSDARRLNGLQRDFGDWVYRTGTIKLRTNPALKVSAGPEDSIAEFREQCSQAARAGMQQEMEKLNRVYRAKMEILSKKLERKQNDEQEQKDEVDQRKMEEFSASGELLLSLFTKRKRSLSASLSKRRMAEQARSDLEQVRKELDVLEDQARALTEEHQQAQRDVQERWAGLVNDAVEIPLTPQKKDIYIELFGVAWLPFYLVRAGAQVVELPAYTPAGV
jgi:hypothetical protein